MYLKTSIHRLNGQHNTITYFIVQRLHYLFEQFLISIYSNVFDTDRTANNYACSVWTCIVVQKVNINHSNTNLRRNSFIPNKLFCFLQILPNFFINEIVSWVPKYPLGYFYWDWNEFFSSQNIYWDEITIVLDKKNRPN